jgi:predicted porin
MNKKLLSSTALVSALLVSGAALAEFKVGADVTATYTMGSDDTASSGLDSGERVGNETNLKLSGKKELSNGTTASYSGKLEFDGAADENPDHEYELKIGTANAYVAFANDGGQSNRTSMTPFVSYPVGSTANAVTPTDPAFNGDSFIDNVHTSNNIAVGGKVGEGNIVLRYAPSTASIDGNDIDDINADTGTTGSGYLIAYKGKVGALGINASHTAEQVADESASSAADDKKESRVGVAYTTGPIKVGADYIKYDGGVDIGTGDKKTYILGAAYAVDKNVTVGIYHQSTEDEADLGGKQDEDVNMISIGYNLGGASVALSVVDIEGLGNASTGTNADYQGLMITTKVGF